MKIITIESKVPDAETKMGLAFIEYGVERSHYNHHDGRWEVEEEDEHVENMIEAIREMFSSYHVYNYDLNVINVENTAINTVETNDYFYRNIF